MLDSLAVAYLGKIVHEDRLREAQEARRFLSAKKDLPRILKALMLIFM